VQTLLRRKRLLQFSFETIFPLEDFGEERRRERICRQIERRKKREEEEEEEEEEDEEEEEEEHHDDGDDLGFGAGNDLILQGPESLIFA
jgi:ABC-type Zn2+ transport system substrate-binding protein/surface adhesin